VGSTTTTFLPGQVSGGAPFVLQEAYGAAGADLRVSLEWECDTPSEYEELTPPLGFSFLPEEIGCALELPQQFTMRPVPTSAPVKLELSLYGLVNDRIFVALTPAVGGGYDFHYTWEDLVLDGKLNSFSANGGASVTINEMEWDSVTLCDPGTYVLDAED
jgi:hypothetical protein